MTGEIKLRYLERTLIEHILEGGAELTATQSKALTAVRCQREHLARLGWEPPFRWSWWRHPVLAFRQWQARNKRPPRSLDVEAMRALMPYVAESDKIREHEAAHGLVRLPNEIRWARRNRIQRSQWVGMCP